MIRRHLTLHNAGLFFAACATALIVWQRAEGLLL